MTTNLKISKPVEANPRPMRLLSVNVCPKLVEVEHGGERELTGHFKVPVTGRVRIGREMIEGDHIADRVHHGGADMAVYALSYETHWRWAQELGRTDLQAAKFGENLTVDGMPDQEVAIGDRFRFMSVEHGDGPLLEVSVPRAPCWKLGVAMGDPGFPKQFLASCRVGFYLRVLEEGMVGAGDSIACVHRDPARVTVEEVVRIMYFDQSVAGAKRALEAKALMGRWRERLEERVGRG